MVALPGDPCRGAACCDRYVRCLYVYNKIDMTSIEETRRIMAQAQAHPHM